MAQRGLDIELRKKFQGMEFKDFYEVLAAKVTCIFFFRRKVL